MPGASLGTLGEALAAQGPSVGKEDFLPVFKKFTTVNTFQLRCHVSVFLRYRNYNSSPLCYEQTPFVYIEGPRGPP
jgi:hypothetical protein